MESQHDRPGPRSAALPGPLADPVSRGRRGRAPPEAAGFRALDADDSWQLDAGDSRYSCGTTAAWSRCASAGRRGRGRLPLDRRSHRFAEPAGQAAPGRRRARLSARRHRDLWRRPAPQLARPRSLAGGTRDAPLARRPAPRAGRLRTAAPARAQPRNPSAARDPHRGRQAEPADRTGARARARGRAAAGRAARAGAAGAASPRAPRTCSAST